MTTLVDDTGDTPCSQPVREPGDGVIVVLDRSTELKLMDDDVTSCVAAFEQGRTFRRIVAYVYVPTSGDILQFDLDISGIECNNPSFVVYHAHVDGDQKMECILTEARDVGAVQQCKFMCTNICPKDSVFKVYFQTQRILWEQNDSASICKIKLMN